MAALSKLTLNSNRIQNTLKAQNIVQQIFWQESAWWLLLRRTKRDIPSISLARTGATLEPSSERQPSTVRPSGSAGIEHEKLQFERQKLALELRLRRQELNKNKVKGNLREALGNPLMLAIVGGIITLLSSIASNYLTNRSNIELETLKASLSQQSARETLQADLIKKFVESSKIEVVRQNLGFLADSGLIPTYANSIRNYLKANPDAAPRVGGGIAFSPGGEDVDDSIKQAIQDAVMRYREFLQKVGFSKLDQSVSVYIYSGEKPPPRGSGHTVNAYYANGTIFMHKSMVGDLSIALREYTHYALNNIATLADANQDQVEWAIADYLPASFLGSPVIGARLGNLLGLSTEYVRRLDVDISFDGSAMTPMAKGRSWGMVLWACRQKVGQGLVDGIVLPAWTSAKSPPASSDVIAKRFAKTITDTPSSAGSCFAQEIAQRHLP